MSSLQYFFFFFFSCFVFLSFQTTVDLESLAVTQAPCFVTRKVSDVMEEAHVQTMLMRWDVVSYQAEFNYVLLNFCHTHYSSRVHANTLNTL